MKEHQAEFVRALAAAKTTNDEASEFYRSNGVQRLALGRRRVREDFRDERRNAGRSENDCAVPICRSSTCRRRIVQKRRDEVIPGFCRGRSNERTSRRASPRLVHDVAKTFRSSKNIASKFRSFANGSTASPFTSRSFSAMIVISKRITTDRFASSSRMADNLSRPSSRDPDV